MRAATDNRPVCHIITVGASLLHPGESHDTTCRECAKLRSYVERCSGDYGTAEHDLASPTSSLGQALTVALSLGEDNVKSHRQRSTQDCMPQELSYLHLFYLEQDRPPNGDKVLLLSSDDEKEEGKACAAFDKAYLKQANFKGGEFTEGNIERKVICGLDPEKEQLGQEAIGVFTECVAKAYDGHHKTHCIILNISGGFKGLIPYATFLAAIFEPIELTYLYATSPVINYLPKLPVAFDAAHWRDWKWLVEAIKQTSDEKQRKDLLGTLPPKLRVLFDEADGTPGFFGQALSLRFKQERPVTLDLHGPGEQMLALLTDNKVRKVAENAIRFWRHAALGDKVPEMVEHGRGHVQRVQELLMQILHPLLQEDSSLFGQEELLALCAATWLHDIGHAAEHLDFSVLPAPWDDVWNRLKGIHYPTAGFPTLSREFHHLLSAALINDPRTRDTYLPDSGNWTEERVSALTGICLYHRREMPLACKAPPYTVGEQLGFAIGVPCPKEMPVNGEQVRTRLLAALYSICDGLDTQIERAAADDELRVRRRILKREVEALLDQLEPYARDFACPCMRKLADEYTKCRSGILGYCQDPTANVGIEATLDSWRERVRTLMFPFMRQNAERLNDPAYRAARAALSLLDQIQFKARQPGFYHHHRGIQGVYVTREAPIGGVHQLRVHAVYYAEDKKQARKIVLGENPSDPKGSFSSELTRCGCAEVLRENQLAVLIDRDSLCQIPGP